MEWKVGQKVAITRGCSDRVYSSNIKRIMKRFVELDDGSRWKLNGHIWGGGIWDVGIIVPWNEQFALLYRQQEAVSKLKSLSNKLMNINMSRNKLDEETIVFIEQSIEVLSKINKRFLIGS